MSRKHTRVLKDLDSGSDSDYDDNDSGQNTRRRKQPIKRKEKRPKDQVDDNEDDPVEQPKVPYTRSTITSFDELDLTPEMRLRPEFQNDAALREIMETLTYEDLVAIAMRSPVALQRFFGLEPPPLPKDVTDIDLISEDTRRNYILADNLLAPIVFEILLQRDFGIAYKSQECSAKTEAERDAVSNSLASYAPVARWTKGVIVTRREQLRKLRELYVWIVSAGNPNKTGFKFGVKRSFSFRGDGITRFFVSPGSPAIDSSVITFFLYHYGKITIEELIARRVPTPKRIVDIRTMIPFKRHNRDAYKITASFVGEKSRYFTSWLKSASRYTRPLGIFELKNDEGLATTLALVSRQLVAKMRVNHMYPVPGYILTASVSRIYCISITPSKKSFWIDCEESVPNKTPIILKYIDKNGDVSPRVIFAHARNHSPATSGFVVIDLPLEGVPKIKQYEAPQSQITSTWTYADEFQSNFVAWPGVFETADDVFVFDPSNGKVAQYSSKEVSLSGRNRYTDDNLVLLRTPAIAFNFASPKSVLRDVEKFNEPTMLFPVKDLSVTRAYEAIVDIGFGEPLPQADGDDDDDDDDDDDVDDEDGIEDSEDEEN